MIIYDVDTTENGYSKLAWQVLAEYINDRTFSKETQWIMSADIPEGGNYIC